MSGGSYNYLCYRTEHIGARKGDLDAMADRLKELVRRDPVMMAAWTATRRVQSLLAQAEQAASELTDVWKAVEWYDSSDWGLDQVVQAGEEYADKLEF